MAKFEVHVNINRPIQEIFDFVSNYRNNAMWQSNVLEAEITSAGPIGVGTTYRYATQLLGRRLEMSGEVTSHEPPTKNAWKATSGPFPVSGSITLEAVDGGARVAMLIDAEPAGFFKLGESILMGIAKRQFEGDLHTLKDLLESEAMAVV